MAKNVNGKKKTIRNILIGVITVLVIAAAIFLAVALQKDGAGLNCFQRSATVATADGVSINMSEYRISYDTLVSNYQAYGKTSFSEDEIRDLQKTAAQQALMQKIYPKEAKALGLSLTDEQKASAKTTAQNQIDQIRKYYTESLVSNGNYSKSAVEKQIANYYQQLGMTEGQYRRFLEESTEASYYGQAIEAYYQENGSGIDENTLVSYYRKSVEDSMKTVDADGTEKPTYQDGNFWGTLMWYQYGYEATPMLYIPEGFIYVDFIKIETSTEEEAQEIIEQVKSGEKSFDELMESPDNKNSYKDVLEGPYPIAEKDHSGLYTSDDVFAEANALNVGEIGSFVEEKKTAEDGTTTVTAYLFRRAEGTMCYDGDHGVIKIDYFSGVKESFESQYRLEQWIADLKIEDAVYAYKGANR